MTCTRDIMDEEQLEREFNSIRQVFKDLSKKEKPLRIEWGTREAMEKAEAPSLSAVVCPVCGNPINWVKAIGNYDWAREVTLLAECWSGDTTVEKPRHLFLIKICDESLPIVEIRRDRERRAGHNLTEEVGGSGEPLSRRSPASPRQRKVIFTR